MREAIWREPGRSLKVKEDIEKKIISKCLKVFFSFDFSFATERRFFKIALAVLIVLTNGNDILKISFIFYFLFTTAKNNFFLFTRLNFNFLFNHKSFL